MLEGSCHCGSAKWTLNVAPERVTACNCSLCSRLGALWSYDYENEGIKLYGKTSVYIRSDLENPELEVHFCPKCGGVIAWRARNLDEDGRRRMAVNIRLADPELVAALPIKHFDGSDTFKALPSEGKCVRDLWA